MPITRHLLIGGKEVPAQSGRTTPDVTPHAGKVYATLAAGPGEPSRSRSGGTPARSAACRQVYPQYARSTASRCGPGMDARQRSAGWLPAARSAAARRRATAMTQPVPLLSAGLNCDADRHTSTSASAVSCSARD